MPNTDFTEIKTRIILRNDVLSSWESSSIVLEKGEPALLIDEATSTAKFKIGDGSSTFSQLPFSTLTPVEVEELIKASAITAVASGATNGTIKVTINGAESEVAVAGLKSAAYAETTDFATAEQGLKADAAMPTAGGTFTGPVTLNAAPTEDLQAATKKYVDDALTYAISTSDSMVFKGTVGENGTVADVASITSSIVGDTYKIITDTTMTAEQSQDGVAHDMTVGDLIVFVEGDKWVYVPSGNEEVTTVRIANADTAVNVDGTAKTGDVVLGAAAARNVVDDISTTTDEEGLPTVSATKSYVEKSITDLELGTIATRDVTDAIEETTSDDSVPSVAATKAYVTDVVDTAVGAIKSTEVILHNDSNTINVGTDEAVSGTVVLGTAAKYDVATEVTADDTASVPTSDAVAKAISDSTAVTPVASVASGTSVYLAGVYEEDGDTKVADLAIPVERDAEGNVTKLDTTVTSADTAAKLGSTMQIDMFGAVTGSTTATVGENAGNGTDGVSSNGTFKIAVTSINTDYLENGTRTLVLNGGTATE